MNNNGRTSYVMNPTFRGQNEYQDDLDQIEKLISFKEDERQHKRELLELLVDELRTLDEEIENLELQRDSIVNDVDNQQPISSIGNTNNNNNLLSMHPDEFLTEPDTFDEIDSYNPTQPMLNHGIMNSNTIAASIPPENQHSNYSSSSIFPPVLQRHFNHNSHHFQIPQQQQHHTKPLSSDDFPWSNHLLDLLHNTFKIRHFRDNQKEIINCTMQGHDAFVIMRTGGGKSLTYQLPSLLEGKSPARKVTFVISPLISLIRDQEDQMNEFAPNSALSFTSALQGGHAEHTRRWNLVRDPNSGVCLVFITPEKINKSNRFKSELEKLNRQNRIGRFVIDEAHCCCQWGHDFRPDYTKLGILKHHFPKVPCLLVTATASNRVRDDCCNILGLGKKYQFFRSTANRTNLKYSIKIKNDSSDKIIEDMADFIQKNHSNQAGIIYTFSRKEADEVATKLSSYGISAEAYHSSVYDTAKDVIHRNWMKNKLQVVVATIAFGLGINKPDVRFVLHHTLSKSLEGYYQESGRAGRDGNPANCVLYYSPKDVSRMIGMIHGDAGESSFWSMVRYGQEHGDDMRCKSIILNTLGEPGYENLEQILSQEKENHNVESRQVGKHAKTVVQLIRDSNDEMTLQQIVSVWRSRNAPKCVEECPPAPDLTKGDCERLIIALIISDVLRPKVIYTAYNSIVYIELGCNAQKLLNSFDPKVTVSFPIRAQKPASSTKRATGNIDKSHENQEDEEGWISSTKPPSKRKSTSQGKKSNKKEIPSSAKTSRQQTKTKKSSTSKNRKKSSEEQNHQLSIVNYCDPRKPSSKKTVGSSKDYEVIDILSDDDSDDEPLAFKYRTPSNRILSKSYEEESEDDILFDDSESEYEFE